MTSLRLWLIAAAISALTAILGFTQGDTTSGGLSTLTAIAFVGAWWADRRRRHGLDR